MRELVFLIAVIALIVASATVLGNTHSAPSVAATQTGVPQITNAI